MLQLRNRSPFVATIAALADARGVDTVVVVVKATFGLPEQPGAQPQLAGEQQPIVLADEYWGDPSASSLRYPSEVHLAKPGADVILVGHAHAPGGQAVTVLDVTVGVAEQSRTLRVYGDRVWTDGGRAAVPSLPVPFVRMPLVYERAYGGRLLGSPGSTHGFEEPRNPVGVGLLGDRRPGDMLGQPVPNLEDPQQPLTVLGQTPAPVGVAAIAPSWEPRRSWAGTYDQRWQATRAPYLPQDFDPRFFQVAASGLRFERPLRGGEPVRLLGVDPQGPRHFALPDGRLEVRARVAGGWQGLVPALDTVVLEPDERRLSLVWRASLALGERLLRVERVEVGLAALEGAES
ncbi:MAG: DUF2169 domain-containing protein [Myxococcales bacterium]|nr:DUF2169 domain-containing protein [Myxococcales bacterium]